MLVPRCHTSTPVLCAFYCFGPPILLDQFSIAFTRYCIRTIAVNIFNRLKRSLYMYILQTKPIYILYIYLYVCVCVYIYMCVCAVICRTRRVIFWRHPLTTYVNCRQM